MKIALLADTHAGARNDDVRFDKNFRIFFEDVFFPYIKQHDIKTIIHCGDIFDRRKYINFQTLASVREYFFQRLRNLGCHLYVVAGNHDCYFKNTNAVNSLRLLLGDYDDCVTFFDTVPESRILGGRDFTFIPWISVETFDACMDASRKGGDICIGHFEFDGFQMFQGIKNTGGYNRSIVKDFKHVFTGHFHTRSAEDNITYLGSPYEFVWSDFNDPRGFHIFDTKTDILEFIENPHKLYHKIFYDDREPLADVTRFRETCVKLYITHRTDMAKFELFVDALQGQDLVELVIMEDFSEFHDKLIDDKDLILEDTFSLLSSYIDAVETTIDKDRLKKEMKEIYVEAQTIE